MKMRMFHLGIKNKSICFVLLSSFRNSGFAELTWHSEMKSKRRFLLHFSRFFVTLHPKSRIINQLDMLL